MCSMDPGISFVPKAIMDWAMKFTIKGMIADLLDKSKKLKGSKWEKSLTEGEYVEFYRWGEAIFNAYIASKSKIPLH